MLKPLESALHTLLDKTEGTYGASIYHFESGETFAYNEEETFYAASIIKVPIMAAVFDQAFKGNLALNEKLVLRQEDMVGGSGLLQNLSAGLELSIYDVTMLMIIESDNTATNMLIDRVGKANIQAAMNEWGFEKSEFHNKISIIPANVQRVNMIQPREMTEFLKKVANGKIISYKACSEMIKIMKQQKFQDGLPSLLPHTDGPIGELPLWEAANKTGWITGSVHDMGLLYFHQNTFAVSVFGKSVPEKQVANRLYGEVGKMLFEAHSTR